MSETRSSGSTAIVAVVALLAILAIVWFVFLRSGAAAPDAGPSSVDINVESPLPE